MNNPAVVVIAYNRVAPLKRLLKSLANADYPTREVTLHISIDGSEEIEVLNAANDFVWEFGPKIVDAKSENLGLKQHVLACGQLVDVYDSIIVLEDDLFVSPSFYRYAQRATTYYESDEKVAGVSLYTYAREENNFYPFVPYKDGSDVHFIQIASSWGQSWTKTQWSNFTDWLGEHPTGKFEQLPEYVLEWGVDSWKRLFINYLIDTDRYFVFPNTSYTTNFEEEGTHVSSKGLFQVELQKTVRDPIFRAFEESDSIHDAYFELTPNCVKSIQPSLSAYDFDVDLYGTKPLNFSRSEMILTIRRGKNALVGFGAEMSPLIQNVAFGIEGSQIKLLKKSDIQFPDEKSFYEVTASLTDLEGYATAQTRLVERVTLVIPVNSKCVHLLAQSLDALENDHFYKATILVVHSADVQTEIQRRIANRRFDLTAKSSETADLNELLRIGFDNCRTDFVGWMQAGMRIELKQLEEVATIFNAMLQVNFLRGIDEDSDEMNYVRLNTSGYRWTPQLANCFPKEAGEISTELMFWRRKSLMDISIKMQDQYAMLFLETIKSTPMYVCAKKIGNRNGVQNLHSLTVNQVRSVLADQRFQPRKGLRSITRPLFRYFFKRNVPIFRLFYKETEQLPLVIRYDFKNESFYLDNY